MNLAERVDKELCTLLRIYCHDKHVWPDYLQFFEEAINKNYSEATDFIPQELHYNLKPCRFRETYINKPLNFNIAAPLHIKKAAAITKLRNTRNKRVERFNCAHKLVRFQQGELVLLKSYTRSKKIDNTAQKLYRIFNGPYRLQQKVAENTYIVVDIHRKIPCVSVQEIFQIGVSCYYAMRPTDLNVVS